MGSASHGNKKPQISKVEKIFLFHALHKTEHPLMGMLFKTQLSYNKQKKELIQKSRRSSNQFCKKGVQSGAKECIKNDLFLKSKER